MSAPIALKFKALNATVWSAIESLGARGISTLYLLVFARYLTAAELGVFAAASLLTGFASMLASWGLNKVIIQRETAGPVIVSTLAWVMVGTSVIFTVALTLASPMIATLFDDQQVAYILPVLSLGVVLSALATLTAAMLQRELQMKALARRTLLASLFSGLVGAGLVLNGYGAWGLVAQQMTSSLICLALTLPITGFPLKRKFDPEAFREIVPSGNKILGADILNMYNREGPKLFVGALLGVEALGIFAIAMRVMNLIIDTVGVTLLKVTLPLMAEVNRTSPERLGEIYLRIAHVTAAVIFPISVLVAVMRHELIDALVGDQWLSAAPLVGLMSVMAMLMIFGFLGGSTNIAIGRLHVNFNFSLARALLTTGILLGFAAYGTVWVAATLLLVSVIIDPLLFFDLCRRLGVSLTKLVKVMLLPAACAIAMAMLGLLVVEALSTQSAYATLLVGGAILGTAYLVSLLVLDRTIRKELFLLIRHRKNRSQSI